MALSQRAVKAPRREPVRHPSAGAGLASERGFTLIEVVVAATLLIVSVLATLAMVDRATATTAVSKQRDVGNALAQEMIERATGGRYIAGSDTAVPPVPARNDLTDVDATTKGPADRMRVALDPDSNQSSGTIAPPTVLAGNVPLYVPQTWTVTRKNTAYTVSYSACTQSDAYQGVTIAGPFDCGRKNVPPPGPPDTATSGGCSVGVIDPGTVDPANPGQLNVKLQLINSVGIGVCVGALSPQLSNALCTLLSTSPLLNSVKDALLGSNGALTSILGGLSLGGASVGLCSSSLTEAGLAGANDGIATSTRVTVKVAWTDLNGKAKSIDQTAMIRRGKA